MFLDDVFSFPAAVGTRNYGGAQVRVWNSSVATEESVAPNGPANVPSPPAETLKEKGLHGGRIGNIKTLPTAVFD